MGLVTWNDAFGFLVSLFTFISCLFTFGQLFVYISAAYVDGVYYLVFSKKLYISVPSVDTSSEDMRANMLTKLPLF